MVYDESCINLHSFTNNIYFPDMIQKMNKKIMLLINVLKFCIELYMYFQEDKIHCQVTFNN